MINICLLFRFKETIAITCWKAKWWWFLWRYSSFRWCSEWFLYGFRFDEIPWHVRSEFRQNGLFTKAKLHCPPMKSGTTHRPSTKILKENSCNREDIVDKHHRRTHAIFKDKRNNLKIATLFQKKLTFTKDIVGLVLNSKQNYHRVSVWLRWTLVKPARHTNSWWITQIYNSKLYNYTDQHRSRKTRWWKGTIFLSL
jgi:hypothetical protein